jgi:hypothetical protein
MTRNEWTRVAQELTALEVDRLAALQQFIGPDRIQQVLDETGVRQQ